MCGVRCGVVVRVGLCVVSRLQGSEEKEGSPARPSARRGNQQTANSPVNGQICALFPLYVSAGVRMGRNGMYTGKGCEGVWLLEMKEGLT